MLLILQHLPVIPKKNPRKQLELDSPFNWPRWKRSPEQQVPCVGVVLGGPLALPQVSLWSWSMGG